MKELDKYMRLASHMDGLRSRREPVWRELRRWICPWRGLFSDKAYERAMSEDVDRFTYQASSAVLRGASGMTSGMTPRNISWFKPCFSEAALMEKAGAREWLDRLDNRMKDCLAAGGFYQAIQNFNLDLLWAGCALLYSEKDEPIRFESVQVGTYSVITGQSMRLDAVHRTLSLSVSEAAELFGKERLCEASQRLLAEKPYEALNAHHLCQRQGKSVKSVWWEEGGKEPLREAAYKEMPYFFTVWNEGITPYGTGPADECLADARQMDILERRKLAGLGKLVDPPVSCPPQLKEMVDLSPGAINVASERELIKPIMDLSPYAASLRYLQEEIQTVAHRLEGGLMASIFASMPLDQRPRDMSATEFLERKREALQQLGPVISAYEPTVLVPLLFRTANCLDRAGLTPPLPPSLQGIPLFMKMDFISPMANALRQTGAETTRALFHDVAGIFQATQNQEIFDKIDMDQMIDELASGLGAPGSIVRADEDVEALRKARAQMRAQQEQLALMMQAAAAQGAAQGPQEGEAAPEGEEDAL